MTLIGAMTAFVAHRRSMHRCGRAGRVRDRPEDDGEADIVAYKVTERVVVEGSTIPIDANDSSVWVRRNGQWLCAMHTESLAGDPYGHERQTVR